MTFGCQKNWLFHELLIISGTQRFKKYLVSRRSVMWIFVIFRRLPVFDADKNPLCFCLALQLLVSSSLPDDVSTTTNVYHDESCHTKISKGLITASHILYSTEVTLFVNLPTASSPDSLFPFSRRTTWLTLFKVLTLLLKPWSKKKVYSTNLYWCIERGDHLDNSWINF